MIELNDDKTLFSFDRDLEPVLTVKSGETVRIRTKDCFSNQLTGPQDTMDDLDWDAVNPATGPVFVEGAKAGGALKVRIDNIEFDEQTCSATGQDEGVCGNRFTEWATHYCKIQGNTLAWDERLNIPLRPMIGVIGVAPEGEPVNCGTPGSHGGNMDNKKITKGTRLYFPVRVPGALLQMGDVHATMGDAELCGTGIEIPAEITVRVQLVKGFELNWPVLETFGPNGKWYVNCSGTHYEQALMNGSKELQRLLMRVTGWDAVETYMYMSVQSDVEVSQGCEPCEVDVSLRIGTPKLSEFPVLIPQP